jgi:hypothetical protein
MPIIEGLIDELTGAKWFTCLNLRADIKGIEYRQGMRRKPR